MANQKKGALQTLESYNFVYSKDHRSKLSVYKIPKQVEEKEKQTIFPENTNKTNRSLVELEMEVDQIVDNGQSAVSMESKSDSDKLDAIIKGQANIQQNQTSIQQKLDMHISGTNQEIQNIQGSLKDLSSGQQKIDADLSATRQTALAAARKASSNEIAIYRHGLTPKQIDSREEREKAVYDCFKSLGIPLEGKLQPLFTRGSAGSWKGDSKAEPPIIVVFSSMNIMDILTHHWQIQRRLKEWHKKKEESEGRKYSIQENLPAALRVRQRFANATATKIRQTNPNSNVFVTHNFGIKMDEMKVVQYQDLGKVFARFVPGDKKKPFTKKRNETPLARITRETTRKQLDSNSDPPNTRGASTRNPKKTPNTGWKGGKK